MAGGVKATGKNLVLTQFRGKGQMQIYLRSRWTPVSVRRLRPGALGGRNCLPLRALRLVQRWHGTRDYGQGLAMQRERRKTLQKKEM